MRALLRDKLNNWSFHAKKAWICGLFRVKTTLNQRFLRDKLNKWSFHAEKAWIYGLFCVKTTLNQRFLSYKARRQIRQQDR